VTFGPGRDDVRAVLIASSGSIGTLAENFSGCYFGIPSAPVVGSLAWEGVFLARMHGTEEYAPFRQKNLGSAALPQESTNPSNDRFMQPVTRPKINARAAGRKITKVTILFAPAIRFL
jgi:hypothetical protein